MSWGMGQSTFRVNVEKKGIVLVKFSVVDIVCVNVEKEKDAELSLLAIVASLIDSCA